MRPHIIVSVLLLAFLFAGYAAAESKQSSISDQNVERHFQQFYPSSAARNKTLKSAGDDEETHSIHTHCEDVGGGSGVMECESWNCSYNGNCCSLYQEFSCFLVEKWACDIGIDC
ncbi:hypothetical protein CKO23_12655 [Thiocystis violacea]|nr:hypothetical protein [Thiocystis violacea]